MITAGHFPAFWEWKKCNTPRICSKFHQGKKLQLCIKGPQLDVAFIATFWFILRPDIKSYMLNLSDDGKVSLPWIQNQILWDLLEFSNKYLQILLIQCSVWHICIKPALTSCFPTSLGSKVILEKPPQRADISAYLRGHIRWPRKCHSSKCKNRRLQVGRSVLASGEHTGTISHACPSSRADTLGSSPTWLKRLQLGWKGW